MLPVIFNGVLGLGEILVMQLLNILISAPYVLVFIKNILSLVM